MILTSFDNHQHNALQRKYLTALEETVNLRLEIARLQSSVLMLEIELRKARAALAPVTTQRTPQ